LIERLNYSTMDAVQMFKPCDSDYTQILWRREPPANFSAQLFSLNTVTLATPQL